MILGPSILDVEIKKEKPNFKEEFYHFKLIISLKTSIEQWVHLGGSQNLSNLQFQRSKIDSTGYCRRPNYSSRLVLIILLNGFNCRVNRHL